MAIRPRREGWPAVRVAADVEVCFRTRSLRIMRLEYKTAREASAPAATFRFVPLVGDSCPAATMSLHVGPDGLPSEVRVLRATHGPADDLVEAVKAWRFQPALQHGLPVGADAELDLDCEPWPAQ